MLKKIIFYLLIMSAVMPFLAWAQSIDVLVETNSASEVSQRSAQLSGQLKGVNDFSNYQGYFVYSKNQDLVVCENDDDVDYFRIEENPFSERVTGLDIQSKYHFRACILESDTNSIFSGELKSFSTDNFDLDPIETSGNSTSSAPWEEGYGDGNQNVVVGPNSEGKCYDDGGDGREVDCPDSDGDGVVGPNEDGECFLTVGSVTECPENKDGITVTNSEAKESCGDYSYNIFNDDGSGTVVCTDDEDLSGKCFESSIDNEVDCQRLNDPIWQPASTGSSGSGGLGKGDSGVSISPPQVPSFPEIDGGGIDLSETGTDDETGLIPCSGPDCSLADLILLAQRVINIALGFGFVYVILRFTWVGVSMLYNSENANKLKESRKVFTDLLIGLAIVAGAWLIVNTITNIFIDSDFSQSQGGEVDFLEGDI